MEQQKTHGKNPALFFTTLLKYEQWKGMKRAKTSSLIVPLGIPFQKHQGKNSPVIRKPVGPMGKIELTRWQGEEGQLARLSFEARPTILWLQEEFAHATQEMEALVPTIFFVRAKGKSRVEGFHKLVGLWGFGFFEVKPDYDFGIKSISFTANG